MTDLPQLPEGLVHVRTTDVFDEQSHPAGLRRAHRVADGVWARLVVHTGGLTFVFDDETKARQFDGDIRNAIRVCKDFEPEKEPEIDLPPGVIMN